MGSVYSLNEKLASFFFASTLISPKGMFGRTKIRRKECLVPITMRLHCISFVGKCWIPEKSFSTLHIVKKEKHQLQSGKKR